jgi:hypothetical protein
MLSTSQLIKRHNKTTIDYKIITTLLTKTISQRQQAKGVHQLIKKGSCSVVIFCCEEAGILGNSSVASSSLLIEISFDCSDSLSVGGPLWLTKTKSINKSEEQSKTLEKKDPLSSLKPEEPNKKETSNRETSVVIIL